MTDAASEILGKEGRRRKPWVTKDFQHDFVRLTDEADSSVVLAELQIAFFRECNNQRLNPWNRSFSCSPNPVTDL